MAVLSLARKAAFSILLDVERGHSHSDNLLRSKNVDSLSSADRNLTTALVLGVLRWQIRLDHQIKVHLKHPTAKLDVEVLIALRLGAFQLVHLDRIPARAAIDESVELTKQAGHRFASGMVNAVLQKMGTTRYDFSEESSAELALAEAHPVWMVERWANFFGLETTRAICRYGQHQPSLMIRINGPIVEAELAASGVNLAAGELLTTSRNVLDGDVTATDAFREGRVRLQDEGSQLVAEIAGRGRSILDCCAAPGGKTLILAENNPSSCIVACESSPQRMTQLRKRLELVGDRVECRLADVTTLEDESAYDVVLADVPCSGTGTLSRNPEIRHRLRLEDLPRQAELQKAILRAALRAVRPGGRVIYSTCSLEPEENEQVVDEVLRHNSEVHVVSLSIRLGEMLLGGTLTKSGYERLTKLLTPEGHLRLMPGSFHTDGFFVAMLEKAT